MLPHGKKNDDCRIGVEHSYKIQVIRLAIDRELKNPSAGNFSASFEIKYSKWWRKYLSEIQVKVLKLMECLHHEHAS